MSAGGSQYWDEIWAAKEPMETSWYQREPTRSLVLIDRLGLAPGVRCLDVGAGASTLVDGLLARGFVPTVLDLAQAGLERAKARLGPAARDVTWLVGDVGEMALGGPFDLWHDRAALHFLTTRAAQQAYARQAATAVRSGGHVVVATFSPQGPETCSGLPVARHDAYGISTLLGPAFEPVHDEVEEHVTPWGTTQSFTYAVLRRV